LLADEVGLGKTIEAGLAVAQRWAERKRHILLVVLASLRKQWSQEFLDRFSPLSSILKSSSYNEARRKGTASGRRSPPPDSLVDNDRLRTTSKAEIAQKFLKRAKRGSPGVTNLTEDTEGWSPPRVESDLRLCGASVS